MLQTKTPHDELDHLRRSIAGLAQSCQVDLGDRQSLRLLLDGQEVGSDNPARQELRTLLPLLYRLEAASSEDLGLAGLRRLWQLCAEARVRLGNSCYTQ